MQRRFREERLPRMINFRYMVSLSMVCYLGYFFVLARQQDQTKLRFAPTRFISRMTGRLCNTPLPPYLRVYMYKAFGFMYGVNFDEIDKPLNSFRTFN
jgi:hypothetical protein